jgi:hypothetical protein
MSTEAILWIVYGVIALLAWYPLTTWWYKDYDSAQENGAWGLFISVLWPATMIIWLTYRLCKYVGERAKRPL